MLLEKLITAELEGALEKVSSSGGTKAGQQSTSALLRDDLAETTDHTLVVLGRVELDTSLDAE